MLQEFRIKLDPKSNRVLGWPNLALSFCLFFPCAFLILQLSKVGVLICRQSRSREVDR